MLKNVIFLVKNFPEWLLLFCPFWVTAPSISGWRLPTEQETVAAAGAYSGGAGWSATNVGAGTFVGFGPQLPAAGQRDLQTSPSPANSVLHQGTQGFYWTSSGGSRLFFGSGNGSSGTGAANGLYGSAVRCVSSAAVTNVAYVGRKFDNTATDGLADQVLVGSGNAAANTAMMAALPSDLGLGRYLVTADRQRRKLDPLDSHRYADTGGLAALDGSEGQCMWCWNEHYYSTWESGNFTYEVISFAPLDQNAVNPVPTPTSFQSYHIPGGGTSWFSGGVYDNVNDLLVSVINGSAQYRGGSGATNSSDGNVNQGIWTAAQVSVNMNNLPAVNSAQNTQLGMVHSTTGTDKNGKGFNYALLSDKARGWGDGWGAGWYVSRGVVEYLFRVIMGSRDSQASWVAPVSGVYRCGLGDGVTTMNVAAPTWATYNGNHPMVPTSFAQELGDRGKSTDTSPSAGISNFNLPNANGVTVKSFGVPIFFGLVHPFGHIWQISNGITIYEGKTYVANSMYSWMSEDYSSLRDSDVAASGQSANLTKWQRTTEGGMSYIGQAPKANQWIGKMNYTKLVGLPVAPADFGGVVATDATYYGDYYWYAGGYRVRLAGGGANYGTSAGAFCTHAHDASASANATVSSPLCFFEDDPVL